MVRSQNPGAGRTIGLAAWTWAWIAGLVLTASAPAKEPVPSSKKTKSTTSTKKKTTTAKKTSVVKADDVVKKEVVIKELPALSTGDEEPQEREEKADGGKILERPLDPSNPTEPPTSDVPEDFAYRMDPPLGFTGRSSIIPTVDPSADFVPVEDRWRLGFPVWDRYDRGHALPDDYVYEMGKWWDPYQQNVLKGDYPIAGQHTFLNVTAQSFLLLDGRQTPVGTSAFESTTQPVKEEFFGSPNQFFYTHFFRFTTDVTHGDAGFKQPDWRIKVTPVFNVNSISADELAFVNPNVTKGTSRNRSLMALEEYFVEAKLADLSAEYDTLSVRVGSQFFNSDFRGFLLADTNRAVRIFGSRNGAAEQFNLMYMRPAEKDTNSALNTMDDRGRNILVGNYIIQDFIWPGYQILASIHYNNDHPTRRFDTNSGRVRPDNAGVYQPHNIDTVYFGLGSNGHIERYNLMTQVYYCIGRDSMNPIGNNGQDIRSGMAAAELSYDRDWARFRTSFLWSSGDRNANNGTAGGFDTIFDSPNFGGGEFSFWQRQGLGLFAVNLKNRESLIPNLKSSKIQGQANHVNPGLIMFNLGFDADITPRLKLIHNTNLLWFESTEILKTFLFDGNLAHRIGTDMSLGFEYRPLASNNVAFTFGISTLIPADGFQALYSNKVDTVDPLVAAFFQSVLQY